jgi:cell shape-determining protein MreC
MLIRISLIIAIVAGLFVAALNFIKVKEKITTLITERDEWHGKYDTTYADLTKTKSELGKTKTELAQTKQTLETTSAERDKAMAEAAIQNKRAGQLAEELTKTKMDRDDAQAQLGAYKTTGFTAEQVLNLGKTLKQKDDMLAEAQLVSKGQARQIEKLKTDLAFYKDPGTPILLPASLKGQILVSDPKWDFVVLDIGEDQGVLEHGQLLVNRDGKLVAKVKVTSVQKNRCIANVMPGWKLGEVIEGDKVIPAYPKSS